MNKIVQGNANQILSNFDPETFDMILTSPPYGDIRTYSGAVNEFDFQKMAYSLTRVLKKGGILCWIVGDQTKDGSESLVSFKQAIHFVEVCQLNLHDTMIYLKKNYLPQNNNRYDQVFEYIFIFSKGKPKTFNPLMKQKRWIDPRKTKIMHRDTSGEFKKVGTLKQNHLARRTNVFEYATSGGIASKDKIAYKHPAIFPEKLAEEMILSWSNPGDFVLDPMCGSGTVPKMCLLNNRLFLGIDVSEEYTKIAEERLKQYRRNMEIRNG